MSTVNSCFGWDQKTDEMTVSPEGLRRFLSDLMIRMGYLEGAAMRAESGTPVCACGDHKRKITDPSEPIVETVKGSNTAISRSYFWVCVKCDKVSLGKAPYA